MSRYWAASLLLLIAVSSRLWLPTAWTDTEFYPAVPWPGISIAFASSVAFVLIPLILIGMTIVFLGGDRPYLRRTGWLLIAISLALGFLTDQHRLQPWAYQSFLYACFFVLLPSRLTPNAFRVLTISIYFYSSLGKFDYQFLHTVGQDFLHTATSVLPIDLDQWPLQTRLYAAALFPLSEFTLACLLLIPKTRWWGGCLAIVMHAGLIIILSPLGMNHSLGVLAWNAVLAGQAYWLFIRPAALVTMDAPAKVPPNPSPRPFQIRIWIAVAIILLAVLLPLTERRDRHDSAAWHWDHWLSWALYSPHNSRVLVEIHHSAIENLPEAARGSVLPDSNHDSWHEFDFGSLSLSARRVPVLPQARYQLQLATAIARGQGWTHQVRAVVQSSSHRFDGTRREVWMPRLGLSP